MLSSVVSKGRRHLQNWFRSRIFRQRLQKRDLQEKETSYDGECMFSSIGFALGKTPEGFRSA